MAIARATGAPYVIMHTALMEHPTAEYRSHPLTSQCVVPIYPLSHWSELNFWDRFLGVWENLEFRTVYDWPVNFIIKWAIGDVDPNFSMPSYYRGAQGAFEQFPQRLDWVKPQTSDVFHFDTRCNLVDKKPLPSLLESFVADPHSKGTILFALGTFGSIGYAPKWKFDAIVGAFRLLAEYRIVVQYSGTYSDFPANVIAMEWLPQTDILFHAKTVLFLL